MASLVCGIVGGVGLGSLLAVVFGHASRHRARRAGAVPSGLALAGLWIGYVGLAVLLLLLALANPTFLSQREEAYQAEVKSELRTVQVAQEHFYLDNQAYTTHTTQLPESSGYAADPAILLTIISADQSSYCLAAVHRESGLTMYLDSVMGVPSTTPCT